MKRVKIKGGLGNQMFQYAHGRNLIIANRESVIFDTSFFNFKKTDIDRPFLLHNFNLDNSSKFERTENGFFNKCYMKIASIITGNYGFYQSEKYFKPIESIIRKEFTLKEPLSTTFIEYEGKILEAQNSVSLHVRRGDYVLDAKTNKYHGVCDLTYYQDAIKYINEKIESPSFFVFSDDIEWLKNNLKINDIIFVSNPEVKEYEDLILMSKCKNHIIANSTFSWWGAWLNQNPDKIVIAPKQWTTKKTSDELDILPKEWIQM
jgi:hypothetical protein